MWKDIKTTITGTRESVIKERERVSEKKKPWITKDTFLIVEQRRQTKCDDIEEYRLLNRSIQQGCCRDKEILP